MIDFGKRKDIEQAFNWVDSPKDVIYLSQEQLFSLILFADTELRLAALRELKKRK
jgi:hypothetical protein